MGMPFWIVRLIAKQAEKKIGWEDGPMQEGKEWYSSKGVWAGIVTILVGLYESTRVALGPQVGWDLPEIPPVVYSILGLLGLYARVTATQTIK